MRASTYWNHTCARCFGMIANNTLTPESHVIRSVLSGCRSMTSKSSSKSSFRHSRRPATVGAGGTRTSFNFLASWWIAPLCCPRHALCSDILLPEVRRKCSACPSRPTGRNGTVRTSHRVRSHRVPGPASIFHSESRVHRSSIFILAHRVRAACPPRPRPSPSFRRPRPDGPLTVLHLAISEHEPSTGGLCSPN